MLCCHDEMMAWADDGRKQGWVMNGTQPLQQKCLGRGLHQIEVTCLTVSWMKDARQCLEYGKKYDGYWSGEMFVQQVQRPHTVQLAVDFD